MLSDKAKGKQRAIDDDDFETGPEQRRPITIRFTDHEPDLLLGVSRRDTIRELRALVSVGLIPRVMHLDLLFCMHRSALYDRRWNDEDYV